MSASVHAETDSPSASAVGEDKTAPEKPPRFTVSEYRIEGNSVLPVIAIERAVYAYLGAEKTIADVEQARKSLEQVYQKAGYSTVFVDIPEQNVVSGVVRLRVTEGRIARLSVTGSRYYSLARIRAQLPALAPGAVPYLPQVQGQMNAANRGSADRQITPVFRAGRTPGTVDVELKVKDQPPLHASLELNNRYSANTSHTRASGLLRYDNLWQREHSLSLQYQTAPEETDEVKVLSATYLFHSQDNASMTAIYAVQSSSNIAAVGDITVIGSGDIYGVRRIVPLPPGKRYFHSLSLGVDVKDFGESLVLQGADSVQTPIRYVPFTIAYNASLPGESVTSQFSTSLNFSLRNLADRQVDCYGQQVDQFECKRLGARSNYIYLRAEYQRTRKLPYGMNWTARIDGQVASQPLISNEQFSAGGAGSVRGYLESERLGDDGWQASLEWRSPSFAVNKTPGLQQWLLLIFADSARLRIKDPLPDQSSRFELASAGLGVRFTAWKNLKGELDWGKALKDSAVTQSGDDRVHFRLEYGF
jgi:hemolysin activation/secretion protein